MSGPDVAVTALRTAVYTVPTPQTEGDGTLSWSATTAVTVEVDAGGRTGLGWSYTSASTAALIDEHLAGVARGRDPMDVPGAWEEMVRATRNLGRGGPTSQAIAAVDIALWDLKARLLGLPLASVFGQARDAVPVYGSGGFTTLSDAELRSQVQGWLAAGCEMVKIKVGQSWGARPRRDLERTRLVREVVGGDVQVMVDANGGYTVGQARTMGEQYDQLGVSWFEEPVSSDHLEALAVVRSAVRCDVAAGEYAASVFDARRLCPVLDCLQLDVTRCAGYTEWLRGAALAAAHGLEISGHCAPALHAPVAAAVPNLRHVEWFVDHARLEPLLFEGVPPVRGGQMQLDPGLPGHGMRLRPGADQYRKR